MAAPTAAPDLLQKILADLVGRPVTVKKATAPFAIKPPVAVASYAGVGGALAAVWVTDLPLAAHIAAALSMMPAAVPAESIRAGRLLESLPDNLREIFNVGGHALTEGAGERVALREVLLPPTPIAGDAAKLIAAPAGRVDLDVAVQGYGGGKAVLLFARR